MQVESTAEVVRRRLPRYAVVVVGPGFADEDVPRLLGGLGMSTTVIDAGVEDPFTDVDLLGASVDGAEVDVVVCLGAPSVTAKAIAVRNDIPLVVASTPERRRIAAVTDALVAGSEMRSAVLDVRVDGTRRFASGDVEMFSNGPLIIQPEPAGDWPPGHDGLHLRVRAEHPNAKQLAICVANGPPRVADEVVVRAMETGRASIAGRDQRFRELQARVHENALRELVFGIAPHRRPIVDAAPL